MRNDFEARLREVARKDGRYSLDAYRFVFEALDHALRAIGHKRHVSGRELLEGIRCLALEQFGGLAPMVFENWGVRRTGDFGDIVFNLVDADLMSRSQNDSRREFDGVYDFREAFRIDVKPSASP